MSPTSSSESELLDFLYAAPVGLVEFDRSGTINLITPHAIKHFLPVAGDRDIDNLFAILEGCAPELRNQLAAFTKDRGTICDNQRIVIDLDQGRRGAEPTVLACTMIKLGPDRIIASFSDITTQVSQEARLRQAEIWFASILNDVNDYAVLSVDVAGEIDAATPLCLVQTGLNSQALVGQPLSDVLDLPSRPGEPTLAERFRLAARDGWHLSENWQHRADGSRYWCQTLIVAKLAPGGGVEGFGVVLRDVARRDQGVDDLRRLLTQDHLTGAANRSHFQQRFRHEMNDFRRHGTPLSLVMLDIDHFKRINDSHGHPAGDEVLRGFVRTVAATIRADDLLARLGGEEFAVLMPGTGAARAQEIAEQIRARVAATPLGTAVGPLHITVSLGCATLTDAADDILSMADAALYRAKREGRNLLRCATGRSAAA